MNHFVMDVADVIEEAAADNKSKISEWLDKSLDWIAAKGVLLLLTLLFLFIGGNYVESLWWYWDKSEEYSDKRWTIISESLGNRTDVQCRYRYKQLMRKKSISTSATQIPYDIRELGESIFLDQSSPETQSSEASSFDESLCNYHKAALKEGNECSEEQKKSVLERQIESIFAFNDIDLFNYAMM